MRYEEHIWNKVIKESKIATTEDGKNWLDRLVRMHYDAKIEAFNKLHVLAADKLEKIAGVCVNYNRNYWYRFRKRNCQTFVDDVLKVLEIPFKPEDEFELFMERIRTSDTSVDTFKYKDTIFKSRKEFDDYVDLNWDSETSNWNKRLLIQYSDLMDIMYQKSDQKDTNWGPRQSSVWKERLYSVHQSD